MVFVHEQGAGNVLIPEEPQCNHAQITWIGQGDLGFV